MLLSCYIYLVKFEKIWLFKFFEMIYNLKRREYKYTTWFSLTKWGSLSKFLVHLAPPPATTSGPRLTCRGRGKPPRTDESDDRYPQPQPAPPARNGLVFCVTNRGTRVVMAGRSDNPKISDRVFRVLWNSGFRKWYPKNIKKYKTRHFGYPTIRARVRVTPIYPK